MADQKEHGHRAPVERSVVTERHYVACPRAGCTWTHRLRHPEDGPERSLVLRLYGFHERNDHE